MGIFLDQGCSIIPSSSLLSPKMSSLVPTSHPQPPSLYSMPPGFSCAECLVFEGGCPVLPWHVQCMLSCQPRMEEKDQINQRQRERTRVDEQQHRSYARYYGQRLKHRCEEHVNPEVLGYNHAVSPSHLLQVWTPDPHGLHSTLLPHTLRTPAWDPSAPRSPWTRSVLRLLASAEEVQHSKPWLVKQRMGSNGTF